MLIMNQENIINQFREIIDLLKSKGCDAEGIVSFIKNNFEFLVIKFGKLPNIIDNIYCIYNNQSLYCILIVSDNTYEWSIYRDNKFEKIKSLDKDDECDCIVEKIVHVMDSEKIKNIMPDISKMNIEDKVRVLKKMELNSTGYHFK